MSGMYSSPGLLGSVTHPVSTTTAATGATMFQRFDMVQASLMLSSSKSVARMALQLIGRHAVVVGGDFDHKLVVRGAGIGLEAGMPGNVPFRRR